MKKQKFRYVARQHIPMPYVPIRLFNNNFLIQAVALVDTGSSTNVLPYQLGIDLGFVWDDTKATIPLGGNVNSLAIPISISAIIGFLDPVELIFAWSSNDIPPLILGQIDFFTEYRVCFYQDLGYFEITAR